MKLEEITRNEAVDTLLHNHPSYKGAKNVASLCSFDIVSTLAVMEGYTPSMQYAKEKISNGKYNYFKVNKVNILNGYADVTGVDGDTTTECLHWLEPSTEEEFYFALTEYEASKEEQTNG